MKNFLMFMCICFVLFFTISVDAAEKPQYWPNNLPYENGLVYSDGFWLLAQEKSDTPITLITCNNPDGKFVALIQDGSDYANPYKGYYIYQSSGGTCDTYYYTETDGWYKITTNTSIYIKTDLGGSYISSNKEIRRDRGDQEILFHPPQEVPFHLLMAEIVKAEQPNLVNNLVGTMRVLTLCGVGLLALLMVLALFSKVFRIFQVK